MKNYCETLYSNLGRNPQSPAVWYEGETFDYGQICGFVDRFSFFLLSCGVSRGDRVCVFLSNSLELAVSLFSIAKLGAVCVPIDSACRTEEIKHCFEFSEPSLVLTDRVLGEILDQVSKNAKTVHITREHFHENECSDTNSTEELLNADAIHLFSTGSTGKPKCVARTHINMIALVRNHTATIRWNPDDRVLLSVPISHTYGLGNFVSALSVGACCYLVSGFTRKGIVDILREQKITIFPAVPFMLETLARSVSAECSGFPFLRHVISAGAPLSEDAFFSFHKAFGVYPRQLYGSSETGVITINTAQDIVEKHLSAGKAAENVTVRVVSETGRDLPCGSEGEIIVRSPSMTGGYVGFQEETARVFRNGFYHTGDIGMFDEDGYLFIRGRKKLFINISGNKVDPFEVENLLLSHEKVTEAAVIGAAGIEGREEVKAFIVAEGLSRGEVVAFCRGKISDYKIPSRIEFVDSLPRSPAGKIIREKLG